jgi:hypothetical protein
VRPKIQEVWRFNMVTLFVKHDVEDFGKWKQAYDAFNVERESMGVIGHGVYQAESNPNNVTIYHDFDSMEAAKSFMGSDRLREVMMEAGVRGQPDVWFTTKA